MTKKASFNLQDVKTTCDTIRKEVGKVVVGYQDIVDDLLACLITRGHLFMIGVPGLAKTTLAKTFSMVTGLSWNRIQFTQDMLPSDIIGHYFFDQKDSTFKLRKGPVFGGSVSRRGMAKKKGGVGINITGRSKRVFYPNIQTVRVDEKDGNGRVKLKVCTSCIKAGKTIVVK